MEQKNLIEMANRIGEFFESMPDHDEAVRDISTHVRRYWAPRMRVQILDSLATEESSDMSPIVRESLTKNAASLRPE
jgi:formate dehydrogenase subunit delta